MSTVNSLIVEKTMEFLSHRIFNSGTNLLALTPHTSPLFFPRIVSLTNSRLRQTECALNAFFFTSFIRDPIFIFFQDPKPSIPLILSCLSLFPQLDSRRLLL